jgi:hypothetical protein
MIGQRQQAGSFAGLAGGVQQKIFSSCKFSRDPNYRSGERNVRRSLKSMG